MKKDFFAILVFVMSVIPTVCSAQNDGKEVCDTISTKVLTQEPVYDVVEQMPSFPGGPTEMMKFLADNVKFPEEALDICAQGRVIVRFVVEKDGSISDAVVIRSIDPILDKEALRVVNSMPKWIPGKQNGKNVRVHYCVPVSFRLQ